MISFSTADICDENNDIQIAQPIFRIFGENNKFFGKIRTVSVHDDNSYIKKLVNEKVSGDVMVVDGKASTKCALLGDNLARIACDNGWSGFIINGCIRDSEILNKIAIGIKAINAIPIKSVKKDIGEYSKDVNFAGVIFKEGEYVFSDPDGIVISKDMILNDTRDKSDTTLPYSLATCMKNMNNE